MPEIIIRPAKKEDYPGIRALLLQIAGLHHKLRPDLFLPQVKLSQEDFLERLETAPQNPIVVALAEGEIVGHLFAEVKHLEEHACKTGRCVFYIDDLCVNEACRGQGAGRRLMEEAEALARLHQCETLELNVYQCNESAVRFYERLGFAPQRLTLEKRIS